MKFTMLSKDTRPISQVLLEGGWHTVGKQDVTRISAVDETGEMAYVPWFEVWKGDKLFSRVNARHVWEVRYQEGCS